MYKCGLFLSAGSVEHRTGTTELQEARRPGQGDAADRRSASPSAPWPSRASGRSTASSPRRWSSTAPSRRATPIFAVAAWVGAIFTFASFLKAGHSVFFGEPNERGPADGQGKPVAIVLPDPHPGPALHHLRRLQQAAPDPFIQPDPRRPRRGRANRSTSPRHALAVFNPIAGISIACLLLAFLPPRLRLEEGRQEGLPGLRARSTRPRSSRPIYDWAEKRVFDLYEQGVIFLRGLSLVLFKGIDRPIDFVYEKAVTSVGERLHRPAAARPTTGATPTIWPGAWAGSWSWPPSSASCSK